MQSLPLQIEGTGIDWNPMLRRPSPYRGVLCHKVCSPSNAAERHIGIIWPRTSSRIRLIRASAVATRRSMDPSIE